MRLFALLALAGCAAGLPARADTVYFTDSYGTGSVVKPAYYEFGCNGNSCNVTEDYPFTVASSSFASGNTTIYVADSNNDVSDEIVVSLTPSSQFTLVTFQMTSGLDMTGSPITCLSVSGCQFTASTADTAVGTINWAPGLFTPPSLYGDSTTLDYNNLTGTETTQTLLNFQGGSTGDPTLLPSNDIVSQITGSIGGDGTVDYYVFQWAGGFFSASASLPTDQVNPGSSYLFTEGSEATCTGGGSATLNSGDSYTGTISINNLAPGTYCIGISANNTNDPGYTLTFNSPVGVPEPGGIPLLATGLGLIALLRGVRRRK